MHFCQFTLDMLLLSVYFFHFMLPMPYLFLDLLMSVSMINKCIAIDSRSELKQKIKKKKNCRREAQKKNKYHQIFFGICLYNFTHNTSGKKKKSFRKNFDAFNTELKWGTSVWIIFIILFFLLFIFPRFVHAIQLRIVQYKRKNTILTIQKFRRQVENDENKIYLLFFWLFLSISLA